MIPQKIQPFFRMTSEKTTSDASLSEGILGCCSSNTFKVQVSGEIKRKLFKGVYLSSDDYGISLESCCNKCGKTISVFDSKYDGYEHCTNFHTISTSKLTPVFCPKCSNNDYSICIRYEYPNQEELVDLGIEEIDNAFTWIWITLKCNQCGTTLRNFVDFECD